jgi:hypothetical protein
MAITTKATLKTAMLGWLTRTSASITATQQDEIVMLAEKDIARELRKKVVRASFTLDLAGFKALPAACGELRSIRYNTSTKLWPLIRVTPEALANNRRSGTGTPLYYSVVDNTVLLDIVPSSAFVTEIIYFEALVPLVADGDTNTVLTASPDIYLYACLKEAELFLEHDERNPIWTAKYEKAIAAENLARETAELAGAPIQPQLPTVF